MARPRTHGDPISFRLPLEYDELLAERAAERGETTPEYVRRNIMKALDTNKRKPRANGNGARTEVTPIPKKSTVKKAAAATK